MPTIRRPRPTRNAPGRETLSQLYYFIGVCLRKVGLRNRALGSLVESTRLVKRGHVRRKIGSVTNDYGMARQANCERDDEHAFFGVQFQRYIRSKKSHKLGTRAEIDMVVELVDEYWMRLGSEVDLQPLQPQQRMQLFRDTVIVFPFLSVPEALAADDVGIDFQRRRRLGPADRCGCGSGLPFGLCHGRTPGIDEILTGKF